VLAALVAAAALREAPRWVLVAGLVLTALVMLAGAGLGAYHAGVEWQWWPGPTDCSGPVNNLGSARDLLNQMQTTTVIRCDEVALRILGLSLAGWNVLIALGLAAVALWGAAAARRAA
jgi:disulfide bond formation protein DsbB